MGYSNISFFNVVSNISNRAYAKAIAPYMSTQAGTQAVLDYANGTIDSMPVSVETEAYGLLVKYTSVESLNTVKGKEVLIHTLIGKPIAPMAGRKELITVDTIKGAGKFEGHKKVDPFERFDQKMHVDRTKPLDSYEFVITLDETEYIDQIWNTEGEVGKFVALRLSKVGLSAETRKELVALVLLSGLTEKRFVIPATLNSTSLKEMHKNLNLLKLGLLKKSRKYNMIGFTARSSEDSLKVFVDPGFLSDVSNILADTYHDVYLKIKDIFSNVTEYSTKSDENYALTEYAGDDLLTEGVLEVLDKAVMYIFDEDAIGLEDTYNDSKNDTNGRGRYYNISLVQKQSGGICTGANAVIVSTQLPAIKTALDKENAKLIIGFPCVNNKFEVSVKIGAADAVIYKNKQNIEVDVEDGDSVVIKGTIKDYSTDIETDATTVTVDLD